MAGKTTRAASGQILILTLLWLAVLSGLVFYILNLGEQVNHRVAMQNAADSSAISGAGWMAKSFNLIAMNNVAQTRVLTMVPVLDAFPLAVQMSFEETRDWEAGLAAQINRGVPDQYIKDGLESLRARMAHERDILSPVNDYLNNSGFHMESLTLYSNAGQAPYGQLWQAADAMDNFNMATVNSAPTLAQTDAVRFGKSCDADVAFMSPLEPIMPAVRGTWSQWQQPIKTGKIPDRVYPQRLGPYDRLFLWRDYHYSNITEQGAWVPGQQGHGQVRNATGQANIPGGRSNGQGAMGHATDPNGHFSQNVIGRILLGYSVYGPYEWMMRRIHGYSYGWWSNQGYATGELSDTFFHNYHRQIADAKLTYMWGSQAPKRIHYPKYITDYPTAVKTAATTAVYQTLVYVVEIRSKYPKGDPNFMSAGSYVTNAKLPIARWMRGWHNPEDPDPKKNWGIPRITDYIWEDQWQYETTEDWDIGIRAQRDATGQPLWQRVYMVSTYIFGGIDIGTDVTISNPANFASQSDLPAPVMLDTSMYGDYDMSQPEHDKGVRRDVFTYLGVARKNNAPLAWSTKFGKDVPYPGVVTVAQAEVFNTKSWDLWTQDWKVKLVPVSGWQNWVDRTKATAASASKTNGLLDPEDVNNIADYLGRFSDQMARELLQH